jgi:hypothetical protein
MEGVLIVIALRADSVETLDEIGGRRRYLQLWRTDRRGEIRRHFSAERILFKIGALPA